VSSWLHGLGLGLALVVFAQPFTVAPALVAGAAGAVIGAVVAREAHRQRIRLGIRIAGPLALGLLGWGVAFAVARTGFGSGLWGAHTSLIVSETVRWGVTAAALAMLLHGLALWARPVLLVEAFAVAVALALPWASHRRGMIARPLELSDWFWSHNLDPVWGFVGLGVLSTVIVAALWLQPRRVGPGLGALLAVLLIALAPGYWAQRGPDAEAPSPPEEGGGATGSEQKTPRDRETEEEIRQPRRPRQPVAVVVLQRDVEPLGGMFYLRTTAFSQFNGVRLVSSTRDGVDRGVPRVHATSEPIRVPRPPDTPLRTSVATDVALVVSQERPLALTDPVRLSARTNPAPARFVRRYRVVSDVLEHAPESLFGHEPGDPSWSPDVWEHYTTTPNDPRYLELATRLAARLESEFLDDPWAVGLSIREYLERETVYSLRDPYDAQGESDPTARFLFSDDKVGYCVHLAHSAAMLLRARGIPARVSAGFAVEADRRGSGSAVLVRSVDAHAWAEMHLNGVGWVPLEIVPEQVDAELTPFEEDDLQQLLGEMAREEGRFEEEPVRRADLAQWAARVAQALPGVGALALALLWLARGVRGQRYRFAGPRASAWAYRSALDALSSHGWRRRSGETRESFAQRMAGAAPSFAPLTRIFLEDRLGHRSPRPVDPRVRRLVQDARTEVAKSRPIWRRVLAWVDPLSWLWSR